MFPLIERDFPFIHVSPPTMNRLRQKQLQQVTALTRSRISQKTGAVKKMAEMEQKQKALLHIIKKELEHTKRMVSLIKHQRFIQRVGNLGFPLPKLMFKFADFCHILLSYPKSIMSPTLPSQIS